MMRRFFKKNTKKAPEPKKKAKAAPAPIYERPKVKPASSQRLLTAEGWKRMMMRKSSKSKK